MNTNGFCESCQLRPVTNLIYFDDDGPTFAVCPRCAEASTGYYGKVLELPESPLGGDAA